MEAKRKALTAPFNKFLAIANPANGKNFLPEVAKHWSSNLNPEMTTEKLQNLASSSIPAEEKEKLLKIWNSSIPNRKLKKFPLFPFNDLVFNTFLHKYVFWYFLKQKSLEFYDALTSDYSLSEKAPSINLAAYIDDHRIRQWDWAFNIPILNKEISKSAEWGTAKQAHGEPAMNRLIYRYWTHVLQKEQVVPQAHPSFASWLDYDNQDTMFSRDQINHWSKEHLFNCQWYIEMDPAETPPHMVELRREIEPLFQRPTGGVRSGQVSDAPTGRGPRRNNRRGIAMASKAPASTSNAMAREIAPKGCKRGPTSQAREEDSAKCGRREDVEGHRTEQTEVAESHRSHSQSTRSFGGGQMPMRTKLVQRAPPGAKYLELVMNKSIEEVLTNELPKFEEFTHKARGNTESYLHGIKGSFPLADLIILDQPYNSPVQGCGDDIPEWNCMDVEEDGKLWYEPRFAFISKYLNDDGGILILMPSGLNYELMPWVYANSLKLKCEWQCHQREPLHHPRFDDMLTFTFSVALLMKTGRSRDHKHPRLPIPLRLNSDPQLVNTPEDPLKFLCLTNFVENPATDGKGNLWRGPHEKSEVFMQVLIDMCSKPGDVVVDLAASTGASLRACRASGRHYFGIEEDTTIFDAVLQPLLKPTKTKRIRNRRGMDGTHRS
ncbi:hypothetical protein KC19_7G101700 [Ceratodon purpureus]|uniref:DNA methylase N-4/N-6 domain-containing protein n=1 Tax=Ceratodon purpureus TaxID=3225 RepID=A0A8T0H9G6_CERPU|nr:hypothetical protein KC19_7G101700 [Ceratodon purpureus]